MSALDVFTYADQQVRTVVIDGQPWFVLSDVARVLGITSVGRLASRLPEGVRQTHTLPTAGGEQQMTVVSEPGLYRVVLRSDAPNAEPFITWVTEDVIPTIRKTGTYGSSVDMLAALPSSDILRLAADAAERAEKAEQQVAELTPKATRWDEIAGAGHDFAVDQVAKLLVRAGADTGRNRLFTTMSDLGWLFRKGAEWHAYQSALVYVQPRANRPVTNLHTGNLKNVPPTIRVTGKGLDRLSQHFGVGIDMALVEVSA